MKFEGVHSRASIVYPSYCASPDLLHLKDVLHAVWPLISSSDSITDAFSYNRNVQHATQKSASSGSDSNGMGAIQLVVHLLVNRKKQLLRILPVRSAPSPMHDALRSLFNPHILSFATVPFQNFG